MTTLQQLETGIIVPWAESRKVPEYEVVAAAFLASYRNENTRKNYAAALRVWFGWCLERGIEPLRGVNRPHIELWMRQQEEIEGKSPKTIVHRLNAVSGYYRTAVLDGYISGSPVAYIRRPRVERKSTTNYLTRVEMGAIWQEAVNRGQIRDEAILRLLGANGLRVGELCALNVENVNRERGYQTITVHRKGGHTQMLPLNPQTQWAVERLIGTRVSGPLFLSKRTDGRRLSRGDVQRLVKRYCEWIGIVHKSISPHSFRHSFITLSLNAGVSPRDVQAGAGHADARMTAYYDRDSENLSRNPTFTLGAFIEGAI